MDTDEELSTEQTGLNLRLSIWAYLGHLWLL
jgi:hypothetical protein